MLLAIRADVVLAASHPRSNATDIVRFNTVLNIFVALNSAWLCSIRQNLFVSAAVFEYRLPTTRPTLTSRLASAGTSPDRKLVAASTKRISRIDADHVCPLAELDEPGPATVYLNPFVANPECWADGVDDCCTQVSPASTRLEVPHPSVEGRLSGEFRDAHDV